MAHRFHCCEPVNPEKQNMQSYSVCFLSKEAEETEHDMVKMAFETVSQRNRPWRAIRTLLRERSQNPEHPVVRNSFETEARRSDHKGSEDIFEGDETEHQNM